MTKVTKLIGLLALIAFNTHASELITQTNVKVKRLGSHPGNTFYISLEEGFSKQCKYGLAYCSVNEPSCKSMLSIALTAKATNRPLPDFRYQYNSATQSCSVWLVSMQ